MPIQINVRNGAEVAFKEELIALLPVSLVDENELRVRVYKSGLKEVRVRRILPNTKPDGKSDGSELLG